MTEVPSSTYRIQLTAGFDLDAAAAITDYVRTLGSGAAYLSPILQAVEGSEHGYDVADPTRVDAGRGGEPGLNHLVAAARDQGLHVVVDVVPNHAGVADAAQNPTWWDVLQYGRDSVYAEWYDIDWDRAPLLIPQLGDDVDLSREIEVQPSERTESGYELLYYEHAYPVAPGTGPAPGETGADVLARQHYRLAGYRSADNEQNYRRFFAVTDLAGLRIEDPKVFAATHELLLQRVRAGDIDGLRIDHPDGLADPGTYLDRLRAAAPDAWITVEKILEPGEVLPVQWPVQGTTGYDALTEITNVITDPSAEGAFSQLYAEVSKDGRDFHDHVADGKRQVATTILHAEILRLTRLAGGATETEAAVLELAVAFPVYRSYLPLGADYLDAAVTLARSRAPHLGLAIDALLPRLRDPADELCVRFQQLTGAIMAKGVEDTAYYRYTRALWLNEVGGDPSTFGASLDEFHAAQHRRQTGAAQSMTTLSTHDTKRCEDVRARLAVLAEIGTQWAEAAHALHRLAPVPTPAFGLLLWQTFIGTGFINRDRMHAYAEKAMREANDGTGWRDNDAEFEAAVHGAVDAGYDNAEVHAVLHRLIEDVTAPGWSNALTQKVIALTMPGIPDVYQGTELWDDSLVDPDNRRPVDYARRRELLAVIDSGAPVPAVDSTGAAKLLVTSRSLRARHDRPELFTDYTRLPIDGAAADHAVAFDRGGALTVATRLPVALARRGGWGNTTVTLPRGVFTDAFTGSAFEGVIRLADLLATYPVALLLSS